MSISELRVFRSKNSVVLLYTAIRGGNDAVQKLAGFSSVRIPKMFLIKVGNRMVARVIA